jgi:hypothetical protein
MLEAVRFRSTGGMLAQTNCSLRACALPGTPRRSRDSVTAGTPGSLPALGRDIPAAGIDAL